MFPTGALWSKAFRAENAVGETSPVDWAGYAGSGLAFEANAGVRLGRNYTVFAAWEHGFLGSGEIDDDPELGKPDGASTDFYGGGLRFATNPDKLGLVLELALGYRVFTSSWDSGARVELQGDSISARLGIGLNYRFSESLEISPMITLGSGTFGNGTFYRPNGETRATLDNQQRDGQSQHTPIVLQIGGHFDISTEKKDKK